MPHRQRRKLLKPVNLQYETGTSGLLLQNMPDDSIFTGMGERRISAIDNLLAASVNRMYDYMVQPIPPAISDDMFIASTETPVINFGNSGTFDYIATSYDGYDEIILGNPNEN